VLAVYTFDYDAIGQITSADYDYQDDGAYSYDAAGNRTSGTYQIDALNRMTVDAEGNAYTYDAEGNRTSKTSADGLSMIEYSWDHRNRLTGVTHFSRESSENPWTQGLTVAYSYDAFNRLIGKTVDDDGDENIDRREAYVYDGTNMVLKFQNKTGSGLTANDLSRRFLYGPAVDMVLAEEALSPLPPGEGQGEGYNLSTPGDVLWMLADNQNTVRDVAELISGNTQILNHLQYDAFGQITGQSDPDYTPAFTFTGRMYDPDSSLDPDPGLYYYRSRWYDALNGRFISADPVGFAAGDPNLARYCGNSPTNYVDPSGLWQSSNLIVGSIPRYTANGIEYLAYDYAMLDRLHCGHIVHTPNESRERYFFFPWTWEESQGFIDHALRWGTYSSEVTAVVASGGALALKAAAVLGLSQVGTVPLSQAPAQALLEIQILLGVGGAGATTIDQKAEGLENTIDEVSNLIEPVTPVEPVPGEPVPGEPGVPSEPASPEEPPDLGRPGTLRNPDGTLKDPADQIAEITKYRDRDGLAETIEKSEDVLKNKLRGPYEPSEW
jgi:RHS repeat-associated protein